MRTAIYVRSAYSLLQSTLSIEHMVKRAKELNYEALAICDYKTMYGVDEFYRTCRKENIKPIIGLEVELTFYEEPFRFLLYAKDNIGYQSLIKISKDVQASKLPLDYIEVMNHSSHLHIVLGGESSKKEDYMMKDDFQTLECLIVEMKEFATDFSIGLLMNDALLYELKNIKLKAIANRVGLRCIPLLPTYYDAKSDQEAYRTLCAIQQGKSISDPSLIYHSNANFRSYKELINCYEKEDIDSLHQLGRACEVHLEECSSGLPKFRENSKEFLRDLAYRGLCKRLKMEHPPEEYTERLAYELDVIISKHFEDYFLIVYDFIRFAKMNDIYVGPGRGSAAGSLTSYCIGISNVDPIAYQLVFERFLNPLRMSMPDIDIDFPDNRREEVIAYVRQKYGDEYVANIATFGTLSAKQVLRDVGKALGLSVSEIDKLSKAVPNTLKTTLTSAYSDSSKFKLLVDSNKRYQEVLRLSKKIEGLPRHVSIHAAGIVISKEPIQNVIPVEIQADGSYVTQYQMESLEAYGLIKIDFLGLRNLTIIDNIVKDVPNFSLNQIDLNDSKALEMICKSQTQGVFQLESVGMRAVLKKVKPTSFEEVAAVIALFRPGPMQFIDQYIENRKHPEKIQYLHPVLQPILSSTYGIMIYQEQIIKVAQEMAGFSAGKAELLRKAISKKQEEKFDEIRYEFLRGCASLGYDESIAEEVFSWMENFANYGFNRSHSIAYGVIAMQMAYLKAHYPTYFYKSLLNSVIGNASKMSEYMNEARLQKIKIAPVSLQQSDKQFTLEKQMLYFPLSGIKNFRGTMIEAIIEERAIAPFEEYFETVARLYTRKISKPYMESLINAGALDFCGYNRSELLLSLDEAIRYAELIKVEHQEETLLNYSLVSKPKIIACKENKKAKLEAEKNTIGVYLQNHPMTLVRSRISTTMLPLLEQRQSDEKTIIGCGQIRSIRQHKTKKGDLMAFVNIEDETMALDLVFMPKTYEKYMHLLEVNSYILVEAKNDEEQSCIVWKMKKINFENKEEL